MTDAPYLRLVPTSPISEPEPPSFDPVPTDAVQVPADVVEGDSAALATVAPEGRPSRLPLFFFGVGAAVGLWFLMRRSPVDVFHPDDASDEDEEDEEEDDETTPVDPNVSPSGDEDED